MTHKRVELLETAIRLTAGDRDLEYGSPVMNMSCAAEFKLTFRKYLALSGRTISPGESEALDMVMTKLSRLACGNPKPDTYIDGAAYFAIAGECALPGGTNLFPSHNFPRAEPGTGDDPWGSSGGERGEAGPTVRGEEWRTSGGDDDGSGTDPFLSIYDQRASDETSVEQARSLLYPDEGPVVDMADLARRISPSADEDRGKDDALAPQSAPRNPPPRR